MTIRTFGPGMSGDEVREHIYKNDLLLVLYANKEPSGFAGLKYKPKRKIANLSAAVISPYLQGKGLYKELSRIRIYSAIVDGYDVITTTTQNPRVEKAIIDIMEEFRSRRIVDAYSFERRLVPCAFGRALTNDTPLSRSERINTEYKRLYYNRGDAYYLSFTLHVRKKQTAAEAAEATKVT